MVSNDSGITWQDLTPPAKIQLTFVKYITNNLVAAIGNGSELFLSSDSCKTWTKHDLPTGLNVSIAFGDSLNCWIADDSSRIYHSNDLGATWTVQKELNYLNPQSTLDPPLYGINFFDDIRDVPSAPADSLPHRRTAVDVDNTHEQHVEELVRNLHGIPEESVGSRPIGNDHDHLGCLHHMVSVDLSGKQHASFCEFRRHA